MGSGQPFDPPASESLPGQPKLPNPVHLVQCSDSLADVSVKFKKLVRFFIGAARVGQDLVNVQLHGFVFAAKRVIALGPEAAVPEKHLTVCSPILLFRTDSRPLTNLLPSL